ncbi:aprataxin-like protein [Elasticomyces elasticus]|nr:aprataxin-like protein [Elasticomyces elasticus]KAK4965314.1 aprataxin-like protein [Elasticomyces elasticus]
MPSTQASADDYEDHVESTALPGHVPSSERPNAFAELMSPKKPKAPKPTAKGTDTTTKQTVFLGRDGLAAYTTDPASFPPSRVVYYNDKFVVINDLFPKSAVHLLILPRGPKKNIIRPQEAFDDPAFLRECQEEENKVRSIVASELRRRYGKLSASDKPYHDALNSDDPPDELPTGRDWQKDIISGTHANPSMNHLHIHVLSKDMTGEYMKKRNHYQSFNTEFLIGMDQYPLSQDDGRRHYRQFPEDMKCWRCGMNFGNKMTRLREHLVEEAEAWKRE